MYIICTPYNEYTYFYILTLNSQYGHCYCVATYTTKCGTRDARPGEGLEARKWAQQQQLKVMAAAAEEEEVAAAAAWTVDAFP